VSNVFRIVPPDSIFPPDLRAAVNELVAGRREKVYSVAGEYMANLVRRYILSVAPQNHKTANSFRPPATPTGHLEKAARNTIYRANADSAVVQVTSPGITRAFHTLEIRSKGKMLTIPARTAPEAYGRRAREVALTERLFLVKTKSGGAFLATGDESKRTLSGRGKRPAIPKPGRPNRPHRPEPKVDEPGIRPVYWLRAAVTIPQKRNILPSDAALVRGATAGVSRGVQSVLRMHGVAV
jgi:hypothetical protein